MNLVTQYRLPEVGEGIHEVELIEWLVRPGQEVNLGDGLAEVLTDKATIQLPSPFQGRVSELLIQPGEEAKVGQVILSYEAHSSQSSQQSTDHSDAGSGNGSSNQVISSSGSDHSIGREDASTTSSSKSNRTMVAGRVRAAPSVRRLARQREVDLATITGSGPGGRILIADVIAASTRSEESDVPDDATTRPNAPEPDSPKRIKLRGVRRKIARQMVRASQEIPHFSYVDQCNVTELVRLRNSLKASFADAGVKLTYLPLVIKAVARSLAKFPQLNATFDAQNDELLLADDVHLGLAVATSQGLIVPVLRDAQRKDVQQIAEELQQLTERARLGKATPDDLSGGTFTITSIGSIGGLISTPIINHPQVAILGIGKIFRQPVYDEDDKIVPAHLMYLSFSMDHRVIDGDMAAHFSNDLMERLKNPATLLLRD